MPLRRRVTAFCRGVIRARRGLRLPDFSNTGGNYAEKRGIKAGIKGRSPVGSGEATNNSVMRAEKGGW